MLDFADPMEIQMDGLSGCGREGQSYAERATGVYGVRPLGVSRQANRSSHLRTGVTFNPRSVGDP